MSRNVDEREMREQKMAICISLCFILGKQEHATAFLGIANYLLMAALYPIKINYHRPFFTLCYRSISRMDKSENSIDENVVVVSF